jgi:hypothetical protein
LQQYIIMSKNIESVLISLAKFGIEHENVKQHLTI